jgi:diacylglycerol kinase
MGNFPFIKFIKGRKQSFRNAFRGLNFAIRTQKNAQIHLAATVLVVTISLGLKVSLIEFAIILFCVAIVWITEIFNTALETLVDLCSPEYHPLAKISKDLSAAAVLISALFSAVIGLIILIPRIYQLFEK